MWKFASVIGRGLSMLIGGHRLLGGTSSWPLSIGWFALVFVNDDTYRAHNREGTSSRAVFGHMACSGAALRQDQCL